MIQISKEDKNRLINFINENELDYNYIDNDISKFSIVSDDGIVFYLYNYNEGYVLVKYDKVKEMKRLVSYEYFNFNNMSQILEQLSLYDKSLIKNYWSPTANSIEVPFDKNSYIDEWYSDFISDGYKIEEGNGYNYITYTNESYKPKLISPFNTLHEVSELNSKVLTDVDKLYFEIHPVSCKVKNESYFVKLLCNNEEIFKEYINFNVSKKKGLKLWIETLFNEIKNFKK